MAATEITFHQFKRKEKSNEDNENNKISSNGHSRFCTVGLPQ